MNSLPPRSDGLSIAGCNAKGIESECLQKY
jgi:hypothetical protein